MQDHDLKFTAFSFANNTIFGAKAISFLLGIAVLCLAVLSAITGWTLKNIIDWSEQYFSSSFVTIFTLLVFVALLSLVKVYGRSANEYGVRPWFECGLQAASTISTLALTFTLLGISIGISGLSDQELNPSSIPSVIKSLTDQFSMAFMTTVVGLPVAAALRSILSVYKAQAEEKSERTILQNIGQREVG